MFVFEEWLPVLRSNLPPICLELQFVLVISTFPLFSFLLGLPKKKFLDRVNLRSCVYYPEIENFDLVKKGKKMRFMQSMILGENLNS